MTEFGVHLMLDLSTCNQDRLTNQEFVYDILNKLPDLIGMTKMGLPSAVKWLDKGAAVPGISGFVMIAESHISVHTFPEKDYVFVDVFSCRGFDTEKAAQFFIDSFEAKKVTKNEIKRGLDFPRATLTSLY